MNGETRLSVALASSPDILEYIVSLNPHDFARLRNPLMRKVMPPRITLRRIAVMVGMDENEFLDKINQLAGTERELGGPTQALSPLPMAPNDRPAWLEGIELEQINWVDVTPLDEVLGDPMPPINIAVNQSKAGEVIGIMHKWEPQPLFDIWHSRGFKFWSQKMDDDLWHIFVYRPLNAEK